MLVKNVLAGKPRDIVTTSALTSLDKAMDLLITHKISCLPVLDDHGELVGIISDKDIFKAVHRTKGEYRWLAVADVMTTDLIVGLPDDEVDYVSAIMEKNQIRHVPIVERERLVGLISVRDILHSRVQHVEIENRYWSMYLDGLGSRDRSADA